MYEKVNILAPLLDAAVKAKQKVTKWPTFDGKTLDRSQFVSSSESGYCARRIWFSKNLPLSEGFANWGFAERGHGHEAWIVGMLLSHESEYTWRYVGDEQISLYSHYQSGTPDGLYMVDGRWYMVEFKSIDPRTKVSNLPKQEHLSQVVQNMDLAEECLELDLDGCLIAYSDASDFSKTTEFFVDRHSPKVGEMMVDLEKRAEAIMTAKRAEDVQPEGMYNGGCKTCQFGSVCTAAVAATQKERENHDRIAKRSAALFG